MNDSASDAAAFVATRIWDLPTRVFHAALAVFVTAAIVTAKLGGPWMRWHLLCGETVLTLIAFRWIWGFVGGHWSRFAQFRPSWRALRAGLRPPGVSRIGHSSLGALSVWSFMSLLTAQVATGLVADDEIDTTGPFNALVDERRAAHISTWHAVYGADLLMALIALHLLAVGYYVVRRREPLLRAMWSGDKRVARGVEASRDTSRTRIAALLIWLGAVAALWLSIRLAR